MSRGDGADVLAGHQQQAVGAQAIPAGAADLLVIAFDALRQIMMNDEAHVGFVDPHAKGDGGDHDGRLIAHEQALVLTPGGVVQARMVGERAVAVPVQLRGQGVHLLPRAAIDDARLVWMLGQEIEHLGQAVPARLDRQVQIGAVEAGHEFVGTTEAQDGLDVVAHTRGGCGSQRHAHRLRVAATH